MSPDTALLPLCVALAVLGLVATVVLWRLRRAARGRILQGAALTLTPVALYLTGLLRMVWDAVVALVGWAGRLAFSPQVWVGFSLLAVAVVLWVVGSLLVRRSHLRGGTAAAAAGRGGRAPAVGRGAAAGTAPAAGRGQGSADAGRRGGTAPGRGGQGQQQEDPEMAEIEALLKSRGIE